MILSKILNAGFREEYPQYLKDKLRVSNILLMVVCIIGVGYSSMIALKMPELKLVVYICLFGIASMFVLKGIGMHSLYRFILCLLPVFTVFYYHIGVVQIGGAALPSSIGMMLAFGVFPFVVYDVREKIPLAATVIVIFALLIGFRWANSWLETSIDADAIRTGYIQEVSITVSFLILCSAVFFLNFFVYKSELKQKMLMEEGEKRTAELEQKGIEMKEQMRQIELSQKEEQERSWAAEGFSRFGAILRKNDDLQQLYDELLASLVKYINANQGALYVAEEEDKNVNLALKACYAYGRKKYQDKTLAPGQGLVGQCYLERDIIFMTEVPQGYTYITSGLGDATPACILIVPLIANEKVEGVMEFASFKSFPAHVISFIKKLGEDVAATLSVGRINSLTRTLLEQAQEQAEQMRAQEEEMRQNMEELSATQEEMQRKELEYIQRIKELEEGRPVVHSN